MDLDLEDPDLTFRQMKEVRYSGRTNMGDKQGVQDAAFILGCEHLRNVLRDLSHAEYAHLLMEEFPKWLDY